MTIAVLTFIIGYLLVVVYLASKTTTDPNADYSDSSPWFIFAITLSWGILVPGFVVYQGVLRALRAFARKRGLPCPVDNILPADEWNPAEAVRCENPNGRWHEGLHFGSGYDWVK